MFSPTVTELPRRLEPISPDTFNDGGSVSAPVPPMSNVIELRPAVGRVRSTLAAA